MTTEHSPEVAALAERLQGQLADAQSRAQSWRAKHKNVKEELSTTKDQLRHRRQERDKAIRKHGAALARVEELEQRLEPLEMLWDSLKHAAWERHPAPDRFEDRYLIRLPEEEVETLWNVIDTLRRRERGADALARVQTARRVKEEAR